MRFNRMIMMKYTLPPNLAEIRRTLAQRHNRRVLFLMVVYVGFVFLGLRARVANGVLAVGAIIFAVVGIIYLIRLAKKQSITLGFVCPLCGGDLYDFGSRRLDRLGECPCCKKIHN